MQMQSYPVQQDHMYHGPHCYPVSETITPQGYANPVRPPMGYGYWPWGGSYGSASPMLNHGCCNHSYFPVNGAWGSPYSPHCSGSYPSFPLQNMSPLPPPPLYLASMPREYHCCGCLNHPVHHEGHKNVRIEEEEPEKERRKDASDVPYKFNYPHYPIVWYPPDFSGNGERREVEDKKDGSSDVKAGQKDSPFPILRLPADNCGSNKEKGMAPADNCSSNKEQGMVKNPDVQANENGEVASQQPIFQSGSMLHKNKGDGEGNQEDVGNRSFPYPLFWIPYKHDETKEKEENRESTGDKAATKVRDIPVKEAEQREKQTSPTTEKKQDVSEEVDNGDKVSSRVGSTTNPSPSKSSKLSPVCLRVDPLPKKKNGNGSCPSPPSNKKKLGSQSSDSSKVLNPSEKKEQAKIPQDAFKENKGTKNLEIVDAQTSQQDTMDVKIAQIGNPSTEVEFVQKHCGGEAVAKNQPENAGLGVERNEVSFQTQGMNTDEVEKSCKTRLSEEEAAVIIQSAYRGFEVRRWEPIKKLNQIAEVRERIADVKHLIQAMHSSFSIQERGKQKRVVAETIMSLLMKLDTIQGLCASIRDVRKSLVRELVSLQEQLDSLTNDEHENPVAPESTCNEDSLNKSEYVTTSENDYEVTPTDALQPHLDQTDERSNNESSDISEADQIGDQASEKTEKEDIASCMDKGIESTYEEDEKSKEEPINVETTVASDHEGLGHGQVATGRELTQIPVRVADDLCTEEDEKSKEELINVETTVASDHEDVGHGQVATGCELTELPILVADDLCTEEDEKSKEELTNVETTVASDHEDLGHGQAATGRELTELPIRVADDLCTEEGPNDVLVSIETDVGSAHQAKQELVESSIISEPDETRVDRHSSQSLETYENCPIDSSPWDNSEFDDKHGMKEQVPTGYGVVQPQHEMLQETIPIGEIESAYSAEATDTIGVESKPVDKGIDSNSFQQNATVEDQVLPEEGIDPACLEEAPAGEEGMEVNRSLSEDNDRLEKMMEKLIKSGEEQMAAISRLSGRVKELENKLSRKKKLKVKQCRSSHSKYV